MHRPPSDQPTAALAGLLLWILSGQLLVVVFVGRWLLGPDWLSPARELASAAVWLGLTVFYRLRGRYLVWQWYARQAADPMRSVSAAQSVMVTALVIAGGGFLTWLCVPDRG